MKLDARMVPIRRLTGFAQLLLRAPRDILNYPGNESRLAGREKVDMGRDRSEERGEEHERVRDGIRGKVFFVEYIVQ